MEQRQNPMEATPISPSPASAQTYQQTPGYFKRLGALDWLFAVVLMSAALYALDGQTGKELWSSGNQIESWNHFSGLTVANGRAYVATFDGTLYSFGVAR